MLAYITGKIASKDPTHVIIENGGLGYWVHITLNTFARLQEATHCRLYTYVHMPAPAQGSWQMQLFGFYEEEERQLFEQLLGVSGVGAATVRLLLNAMSPAELRAAIAEERVEMLEAVKGIGPKTARRIVLELKDKVGKYTPAATQPHSARQEAVHALVRLGYPRQQAEQAVAKAGAQHPSATSDMLVRIALKTL